MTLGDWLKTRFSAMTTARNAALEKLNGRKDLQRWQSERRSFFRQQIGAFPKRTPLNVAISKDDGETWENVKTLADDPNGWYCYTTITFTDEHVLLAWSPSDTSAPPRRSRPE